MARAGKLKPFAKFQDLRATENFADQSYPPRMVKLTLWNNIGSLVQKWNNGSFLSEPAERTDTGLKWTFRHPTVTTDDPHINFYADLRVNPISNDSMFWFKSCDYWEAGTRWGFIEDLNVVYWDISWSLFGSFYAFSGNAWKDHVDLAKFTRLTTPPTGPHFQYASWEENQPYQPYRTRP